MTGDLFWLTLTALLAASLWIPYIVGVNTAPAGGGHDRADFSRPADPSRERPWVHRAHRAHLNLLEQLMPMAVLVLIAQTTGASGAATTWAVAAFFWLRVAHAVGMITGWAGFPARPAIFTAGWACVMVVGAAVLLA